MRKLKLQVESLSIQSFTTSSADVSQRGTVRLHATERVQVCHGNYTVGCTGAVGCDLSFPTACGCDENTHPITTTTTVIEH